MDKLDFDILRLLNSNARISFKQISETVGITSPAVRTRIDKMEKDGIIRGYYTELTPKSIGYMVTAFISVSVDPGMKEAFFAYIQDCPNVTECYGITGNYFAMLKVLFRSTMDLDNFLNQIQKYGETSTNIVLSTYKDSHCCIE